MKYVGFSLSFNRWRRCICTTGGQLGTNLRRQRSAMLIGEAPPSSTDPVAMASLSSYPTTSRVEANLLHIHAKLTFFYFSYFLTGTIFRATYFSYTFLVRLQWAPLQNCLSSDPISCPDCFPVQSGKLVEEEEGNLGLWISYIVTGVGANLVSWLLLPRSAVSMGASGAVFGLFTISVLVKVRRSFLQKFPKAFPWECFVTKHAQWLCSYPGTGGRSSKCLFWGNSS